MAGIPCLMIQPGRNQVESGTFFKHQLALSLILTILIPQLKRAINQYCFIDYSPAGTSACFIDVRQH
jgi:hypothetical protein